VNVTGFRGSLAGVILSTSDDVAHFVHALFTGQILADSTVEQMTAFVQAPNAGWPEKVGYGLGPEKLVINGENLIGHTGVVPGYSSIAMHNEEKRYTIVVLSNLSVIDLTELFAQIQNVILQR
jgi:D-alanyl-D-alanine carboxypeptidase